jgi:STAS domain-containing protein
MLDRRNAVSGFRMDLTLRRDDEGSIAIEGPVGSVETRQIAMLVQALLAAGVRQLIVDLDHVERCDPALTAFLERQQRHLAAAGGWMVVDGAPSTPGDDATSLVEIFDIYRHVRGLTGPHGPAAIDRHVGAAVSG